MPKTYYSTAYYAIRDGAPYALAADDSPCTQAPDVLANPSEFVPADEPTDFLRDVIAPILRDMRDEARRGY